MEVLKERILREVLEKIGKELRTAQRGKKASDTDAQNATSAMQSRYDTFREEAQYLSGGHEKRMAELTRAEATLRRLFDENIPVTDEIMVCSIVTLESSSGGDIIRYFLIPMAGGYTIEADGSQFTTLNLAAPLGMALRGKRVGDTVTFRGNDLRISNII